MPSKEPLLRRVEAHELDVRPVAEAVEQPRTERGAAGRLFASRQPLSQIEVVLDLRAVVVLFRLVRVVVPDRREHRHAIDDVAIGLKVGEEPVIVFVAGSADRDAEQPYACIDVVAGREDEPHVGRIDGFAQGVRDFLLPPGRRVTLHADAEVAHHRKRQRRGWQRGIRIGAEPVVIAVSRLDERLVLRRPVPSLAHCPLFVLYEHFVGVLGVGLQSRQPTVIRDFGLRDADERAGCVVHLDTRRPVRSRLRADGILAGRVDVLQIVIVDDLRLAAAGCPEIKRAPCHHARTCASRQADKCRVQHEIPA